MGISIRDGQNSSRTLVTSDDGSGFIPHHIIHAPFALRVSRGDITWATSVLAYSYNEALADSGSEGIRVAGGAHALLSSAQTLNITSTSAQDASGGTGIKTVTIYGLGTTYNALTETITMSGQSLVATSNQYLRINSIVAATVGTGVAAAGDITIQTQASPAVVLTTIDTGANQSYDTLYTIPSTHAGFISNWWGGARSGEEIAYTLYYVNESGQKFTVETLDTNANRIQRSFDPWVYIPPKSDVYIDGARISGSGDTYAHASYQMLTVATSQIL